MGQFDDGARVGLGAVAVADVGEGDQQRAFVDGVGEAFHGQLVARRLHMHHLRTPCCLRMPDLRRGGEVKVGRHNLVARAGKIQRAGQTADAVRDRRDHGDLVCTRVDQPGKGVARRLQLAHPRVPRRALLLPVTQVRLVRLDHVDRECALGATVDVGFVLEDGEAVSN